MGIEQNMYELLTPNLLNLQRKMKENLNKWNDTLWPGSEHSRSCRCHSKQCQSKSKRVFLFGAEIGMLSFKFTWSRKDQEQPRSPRRGRATPGDHQIKAAGMKMAWPV